MAMGDVRQPAAMGKDGRCLVLGGKKMIRVRVSVIPLFCNT